MSDFKVITPKRDIARELARRYSTMTHDELDILESILEPIKYGKGEKILVEGEVCRNISYIEKGLVRQFYTKYDKEVTEHLGVDHSIFMCIESLFKETPSYLQVEALEPTLVYALPKAKLEAAAMRNVSYPIKHFVVIIIIKKWCSFFFGKLHHFFVFVSLLFSIRSFSVIPLYRGIA